MTTIRPSRAARARDDDASDTRRHQTPERPAGNGLLWAAVFTLVPYAVGVMAMIGVAVQQDRLAEAALLAASSAPYAALGTGLAWFLVLAMGYGPFRRWRGTHQGLLAAVAVYAVAAVVAAAW